MNIVVEITDDLVNELVVTIGTTLPKKYVITPQFRLHLKYALESAQSVYLIAKSKDHEQASKKDLRALYASLSKAKNALSKEGIIERIIYPQITECNNIEDEVDRYSHWAVPLKKLQTLADDIEKTLPLINASLKYNAPSKSQDIATRYAASVVIDFYSHIPGTSKKIWHKGTNISKAAEFTSDALDAIGIKVTETTIGKNYKSLPDI